MTQPEFRRGVVLLAAGSGQRMRPLTDHVPKALLPLPHDDGRTVLDTQIAAVLAHAASTTEVVVVTGFVAAHLDRHVQSRFGERVRTVHNPRWQQDANIGSAACGVAALRHPGRGYLIVETDLLLDSVAWGALFQALAASDDSFWVTRGVYGPNLTGGVVHADESGWIDVVDYRPHHDPACDGWPKMLGMLAVGPREVDADRTLRAIAMQRTLQQYYLMPWKTGLSTLRARVLALQAGWAASFNTPAEFDAACRAYLERQAEPTVAA